jgi:hypothetical protein
MSAATSDRRTATGPNKENRRMPKRLATILATLGAGITMVLAVLPVAPASAAEPWWQILDGSRPSHLWEPKDAAMTQEVTGTSFNGLFYAVEVEVGGETIGCLGSGNLEFLGGPTADQVCEAQTGSPASETAAEFEAMLEGSYGAGQVEVTGGPAGALAFEVTSPWDPPIDVSPLSFSLFGEQFPAGEGVGAAVLSEGSGRLVATLTNLGSAPVDGGVDPVQIVDELPEGVAAYGVEAIAGTFDRYGPVECSIEASDEVACDYEGVLPPYVSIEVEIEVAVTANSPAAGAPGTVSVSGGNAEPDHGTQTVEVSDEPVPFGVERFSARAEDEGGALARQAGSHPFQFTTTVQLNAGRVYPAGATVEGRNLATEQPALPRNLDFPLPAGLVGNATAMPQCEMTDFLNGAEGINECPDATAVGVSAVTMVESGNFGLARVAVPVFNLPPANGQPARFGFFVVGVPVVIDTEVRPDDDYRIVARVNNATQVSQFLSATTSLWGTPGHTRHDNARGWGCVYFTAPYPCERPDDLPETAFLRMPVNCDAPLDFGLALEPWNVPIGSVVDSASYTSGPMIGCNRVPFDPKVDAAPSSKLAESSSGLSYSLRMPNSGLLKGEIAEGQPKRVEVTLPRGMTLNPSAAEGLATCSPSQYAAERAGSRPGEGCPDASKIGNVEIDTPLIEENPQGALYQAAPKANPFGSLLAVYLVARVPERGVLVKLAGKVSPDPETGQIVTVFDDAPQLPFSSFDLNFREGARAPLVTPPTCGSHEVVTRFVPWSASDPDNPQPQEVVERTSTFTVQRGVDGGACPSGGTPSFDPGFEAGSLNNNAGSYSPFYMRLTRRDGEQNLTKFSATLPKGALAKLASVTQCPQAAVEAAEGRDGLDEKASPSCPASSRIGQTKVGAGVGSVLTYVPGQLYLGGPYKGAPLSVVSITPAVAGPFDVGTVVVQEALRLDPRTGEVRVDGSSSDPIPHILAGIPLKVRDIRVYVDRPEFTTTPTSCDPMATGAVIFGSGVDVFNVADDAPVALSARYQAAACGRLGFKPRLKIHLASKRSTRGAFPRVRGVFRPRAGHANAEDISVILPGSQMLENAHFRTICTRVQFAANGGLGGGCPRGAIYGRVKAWTPLLEEPLAGPVYLRSSDNELPDLVLALKGLVDIESAARIDSVDRRIRVTFEDVPDAPLTKVLLNMQGGKKGLIVNATDMCRGVRRATGRLTGHNGKRHVARPKVTANCKGKRRR